jgi:hypothetical protein
MLIAGFISWLAVRPKQKPKLSFLQERRLQFTQDVSRLFDIDAREVVPTDEVVLAI